jgi:hypothetical protein
VAHQPINQAAWTAPLLLSAAFIFSITRHKLAFAALFVLANPFLYFLFSLVSK